MTINTCTCGGTPKGVRIEAGMVYLHQIQCDCGRESAKKARPSMAIHDWNKKTIQESQDGTTDNS